MKSEALAAASVSAAAAAGGVRFVAIEQLHTSYAPLRAATASRQKLELVAPLPLRVGPRPQGQHGFEVLDGFKRLDNWREQGFELVPVVVEAATAVREQKKLVLTANAPACTSTALDEARVVCSLMEQDGCTMTQVARLLGHKAGWVAQRKAIGTRLSPCAQRRLADGAMGPTLAYALTALSVQQQDAVLEASDSHGLKQRELRMLVDTYRVADDADRKQLLSDPVGAVRAEVERKPTLSPTAIELENTLRSIRCALQQLEALQLPEQLAPAELRRLQALHRAVLSDLQRVAARCEPRGQQQPQEPINDMQRDERIAESTTDHRCVDISRSAEQREGRLRRRGIDCGQTRSKTERAVPRNRGRDCTAERVLRQSRDSQAPGAQSQKGASATADAGVEHTGSCVGRPEQARALLRCNRIARTQGPDHEAHLARDSATGLSGRPYDPGTTRAQAQNTASAVATH